MESASVYEQTTIIHELSQGIQMAKQLRLNLESAEARQFLIQNILSSYDKALFLLQSAGQPQLPESSLPKSSTSTGSMQSREFELDFDQNVVSKKRKLSPPPPPSPEKHEANPTNHDELSSPNSGESLSNLRSNLSVNTWDLSAILPASYSFPSTPFGFRDDDDFERLNNLDDIDELLQGYSPPFISPATSESNHLTEYWGSSSTLDFLTEPEILYPNLEFNDFFL